MSKIRGLVFAGLIGLLALGAAPAQAAVTRAPVSAVAVLQASSPRPFVEQAPPGPVLDPGTTKEADSKRTQTKIIAGGVAVVLLLLVLWGRSVRKKRRE